MKTRNKVLIFGFILLIVLLCFIIMQNTKKTENNENDNKEQTDEEFKIDNEDYYIQKQKEFDNAEDDYENYLTQYIEEKFKKEEKDKIAEYNKKWMEETDKQAKIKISHEKAAYIKEVSKTRFTKEELDNLEQIQKKKDELEPIVDEYNKKLIEREDYKFWKDREKLADGSVVNKREDVISDKEFNGLKFSNIQLKYDSAKKCSIFSAMVTNVSNQIKEGKVGIKITGDAETVFPINIERLQPGEYYEFEIENSTDLSMAGKLEVIEYK